MSATGKQQLETRSWGMQESIEGEIVVVIVVSFISIIEFNLFKISCILTRLWRKLLITRTHWHHQRFVKHCIVHSFVDCFDKYLLLLFIIYCYYLLFIIRWKTCCWKRRKYPDWGCLSLIFMMCVRNTWMIIRTSPQILIVVVSICELKQ